MSLTQVSGRVITAVLLDCRCGEAQASHGVARRAASLCSWDLGSLRLMRGAGCEPGAAARCGRSGGAGRAGAGRAGAGRAGAGRAQDYRRRAGTFMCTRTAGNSWEGENKQGGIARARASPLPQSTLGKARSDAEALQVGLPESSVEP
jgi:hypothetical protein